MRSICVFQGHSQAGSFRLFTVSLYNPRASWISWIDLFLLMQSSMNEVLAISDWEVIVVSNEDSVRAARTCSESSFKDTHSLRRRLQVSCPLVAVFNYRHTSETVRPLYTG
jgi:hypothetical protein